MEISENNLNGRIRKSLGAELRFVIVTPVRNEVAYLEVSGLSRL